MKKNRLIIFVLVFAVFLIGSVFLYNMLTPNIELPQPKPSSVGGTVLPASTPPQAASSAGQATAPDFTVLDTAGNQVKLSDFFGKPIVLNFWASWCGPCKEEMPDFEKVYKEMGSEVTFMMVNLTDGQSETVETATAFIEAAGYTFPIYFDTGTQAAQAYGVTGIPTTYFLDANGVIVSHARGTISEKALRSGIAGAQESGVVNEKITSEEAKALMDSLPAFLLLDVRTPEEYAAGHIAGAVLMPDYELADRMQEEYPDKTLPIFVYCRSGRRSAGAAQVLGQLGYTTVYDFGGIMDWPYPLA